MTGDVKDKLRSLSIDRAALASRKRGGRVWLIAAAVGVAGIAGAMSLAMQPAAQAVAAPAAVAAVAVRPVAAPPSAGAIASGYVVARRSAMVSADISGRLLSVDFEEGASVRKGQVLASLDDGLALYDLELARARLQSARATVQAVKADMVEGQAQLHRAQQLSRTSTISPAALDAAKTRIQALTARHEAAVADARVAQVAVDRQAEFIERHKIRAPFDGVIISKNAQAGEVLSTSPMGGEASRAGVAMLVDMSSLEVEVDVSESQIASIAKGQDASVVLDAYPDSAIPARVLAVIPTADRDRATIQVRVAFTELDPRIVPQMAAKVTFTRTEE